ncbi:hypothetical protein PACTADRAFT_22478, partial [Pachysolen tannophilus NRRL Y-2460]
LPPFSMRVIALCGVWYFVSSTTSQLTKEVLDNFPYPSFVGEFQFFISSVYCIILSFIFQSFPNWIQFFPKGTVPVNGKLVINRIILRTTIPLGIFQFLGKFSSLASTSRVPISTVSSIKSLSPMLIVLGYRFYYKVKFPILTYVSLAPLVVGVVLIVLSDNQKFEDFKKTADLINNKDHLHGIFFAILSTFIFATQNIYAKNVVTYNSKTTISNNLIVTNKTDPAKLALSNSNSSSTTDLVNNIEESKYRLPITENRFEEKNEELMMMNNQHIKNNNSFYYKQGDEKTSGAKSGNLLATTKPDKITILWYCSTLGFLFQLPFFLLTEFPRIFFSTTINTTTGAIEQGTMVDIPLFKLILNGSSHFIQALLAFHLLGTVPTVTYSIASMMKRIIIITVSMILAGHSLNSMQISGLILIGIGLYSYDRW